MENGTTVPLSQQTKQELVSFKNHPSETFEQLFQRILKNLVEDDDLLTKDDLEQIDKSLEQIREGKFKTQKQMKEKYGIK